MRKFLKIIVFWLITWTIYNSVLIVIELYLLFTNKIEYGESLFLNIYCCGLIFDFLRFVYDGITNAAPHFFPAQFAFIFIIYMIIVDVLAVYMWWQK